jgi:hypothetical protein
MTRPQIASLMMLMLAVPAGAGVIFAPKAKPCFVAGNAAYRIADSGTADVVVRIDNKAARATLSMQIVDDAAAADFVLVDDENDANACSGATETIRVDGQAAKPDMTVTLSNEPAAYKIYVRSARFSTQDAAALFAVLWRHGPAVVAARN